MLDGTHRELGILETLSSAHEIREIFDPSPLVTVALHRLLLAILHRIFGPASAEEWKSLWESRHFNERQLQNYLNKWHSRFDLFDKEYPFYQTAEFGTRKVKTVMINNMLPEMARGNNPTLFDHTFDNGCASLDCAAAARNLISLQAFKLGGLSGLGANFVDAPSARSVIFLVRADDLFGTLMLNAIRYDVTTNEPIPSFGDDNPAWEQNQIQESALPQGYLDYLTWQTLLLRLVADHGTSKVVGCEMALGRNFRNDSSFFDPAVAYRKNVKAGWLGFRFRENRMLWRDSTSLFTIVSEDNRPPLTIQWLSLLVKRKIIDRSSIYRADAYGMGTNQARIDFWRHERLPLPLHYLADESLIEDLQRGLGKCEKSAKVLRYALRISAKGILAAPEREPDKDDVTALVNHFGSDRQYWSRLEPHFHSLLTELPHDWNQALNTWGGILRRTCWVCFEDATRDLAGSARTLRSIVEARQSLGRGLKQVFAETG